MKRITTILLLLAAMFASVSCIGYKERKQLVDPVKGGLCQGEKFKLVSFGLDKVITLEDEIDDALEYQTGRIEFLKENVADKLAWLVKCERDTINESILKAARFGYEQAQDDYDKALKVISYLQEYKAKFSDDAVWTNSDGSLNKDLGQPPMAKQYRMFYEVTTQDGESYTAQVLGWYNNDGEILALRPDSEQWIPLTTMYSIPGYYEMLE